MGLLKDAAFICLDCEFTGLDPDKDRILEIAAVRFNFNKSLAQFDALVNPGCPISTESFAIHHISQQMVAHKPTIDHVLSDFLSFVGSDIIVGHGIGYDLTMIEKAALRSHIPYPLKDNRCMDTLRLARLYGDSPNNSLESLAQHFNVPNPGSHRALNDVTMNIEVFKHLVRRYRTTEQLFEILSKPIKMKFMPLGKHKGRQFSEIPLQYLQRAAYMDFDQDLLYTIRLELKKRKSGEGFGQATNPFVEL
jgi:DNA polymerase III subunit epsilon